MNRYETTSQLLDLMINDEVTNEAKVLILEKINKSHKNSLDLVKVMRLLNTDDKKIREELEEICSYFTSDENEKAFLEISEIFKDDHKSILKVYSSYKKEYFAKKDKIYKLNLNTDDLVEAYMKVYINEIDFKLFVENKTNDEKNKAYINLAQKCLDSNTTYKMMGFEILMIGVDLDMNSKDNKEFESIRKAMKDRVDAN